MTRRLYRETRTPAQATRRVLLTMLVVIYVIVGFAGNVSCASEAMEAAGASDTIAAAPGDEGSKKSPTVVDHCYTCVPITVPAAAQISEPVGHLVAPFFPPDEIAVVEERTLDTPPPKYLT